MVLSNAGFCDAELRVTVTRLTSPRSQAQIAAGKYRDSEGPGESRDVQHQQH
jgi:hypothetical protein